MFLINLTEINIGGIDFSSIAISAEEGGLSFDEVPNLSSSTIHANTLALGNTFKAKFPNLSNWTVDQN